MSAPLPAIGSGIAGIGSQQAAKSNAAAKKAQKKQEKLAQKQADITNSITKKLWSRKKDYYAQREFQWENLKRQYQYDNSIIDYRYLQDVRMYGKSVNTYKQTLNAFNSIASNQAYESVPNQLMNYVKSKLSAYSRTCW